MHFQSEVKMRSNHCKYFTQTRDGCTMTDSSEINADGQELETFCKKNEKMKSMITKMPQLRDHPVIQMEDVSP